MGLFDVDYNRMTWYNLPVRLRQGIQYAWLKCLVTPVKYVSDLFNKNRANNLYDLDHNGQVCRIEAALNDVFDKTDRGITVGEPDLIEPEWWALDIEDKPVWWAVDSEALPVWWSLDSECSHSSYGFVVNVPGTIVFDMDRMKALIDSKRLPGTLYTIVIV